MTRLVTPVAAGPSSLGRLRRYTLGSLLLTGFALAGVGVVDLLRNDVSIVDRLLLLVAVAAVTAQRVRWLRYITDGDDRTQIPLRRQAATLLIAAGAWAYAVTIGLTSAVWSLLPGGVLSGIVLAAPRRRRPIVTVIGAAASVATAALLIGLGGALAGTLAETATIGLLVMLAVVALELVQLWYWDLVVSLDNARQTAAALAVAEERLRFAADLHDTQGHYLQVIALKGELVERLMDVDGARALREAADITDLARQALAETRGLVSGYRETSLQLEIDNAVGILRAASVDTTVDADANVVPHTLQPLFGALVREGTTNVLRHSRASRCALTVVVDGSAVVLRLTNDGPTPRAMNGAGTAAGSGLAGLRERFAGVGGEVVAEKTASEFQLVGRAPLGQGASTP